MMETRIVKIGKHYNQDDTVNDEYVVEFSQDQQSFQIHYVGTKAEALWMKDQLDLALDRFKQEILANK